MNLRQFCYLWFKKAFNKPLLWYQVVSALVSGISGVISYFNPQWNDTANLLMWAVPLFVFVATFVFGFIKAPYIIYKELENTIPVKLPNRESLLQAIVEAKRVTIEKINNKDNLDLHQKQNTIFIEPGKAEYLSGLQMRFQRTYNSLENEIYIAGITFEPILKPLLHYMQSDNTQIENLEKMVENIRKQIDQPTTSA